MIKLSVNEKNEVFCWPEPALLLILLFRFEYLISGPKSYRDFGQTGPWSVVKGRKTEFTGKVNLMLLPKQCPFNVNLKTSGPNPLVNTFDSSFLTCCICGISS